MAGGNNILLKRDDMVTFFRLPSDELDNLELVKGQLIFVYDNQALYFDVPNWNKQSEEDPDVVRIRCDGVKFNLTRDGQYLVLTSADDPSVYQRVKLPSYTFTPDSNDKHLITIHCDDGTEDVVLDTRYTASDGVTLTGYNFTNSGIRDIDTGDNNGQIKINKNGTISNVNVKGLKSAAFVDKGVAGGVAELDASGLVPSSQLPSYVDDVIEGYYYEDKFYSDAAHTTEITGETGKIYVDLDTGHSFRWSGTVYIIIGDKIQSDWNINDTTQDAYIQNRTHYIERNVPSEKEYSIMEAYLEEEGGEYHYILELDIVAHEQFNKLMSGTLTITIKGVDYTTTLRHWTPSEVDILDGVRGDLNEHDYIFLGWDGNEDAGEISGYLALSEPLDEENDNYGITKISLNYNADVYHQLDGRYIEHKGYTLHESGTETQTLEMSATGSMTQEEATEIGVTGFDSYPIYQFQGMLFNKLIKSDINVSININNINYNMICTPVNMDSFSPQDIPTYLIYSEDHKIAILLGYQESITPMIIGSFLTNYDMENIDPPIISMTYNYSSDTIIPFDRKFIPVATGNEIGGIKVGNNLSVSSDGTLDATIPAATSSILGGVKINYDSSTQTLYMTTQ